MALKKNSILVCLVLWLVYLMSLAFGIWDLYIWYLNGKKLVDFIYINSE